MKKLLLTLIFLAWAGMAMAEDYWVYVNVKNQSGVTKDDDKGISKVGDVIDIIPIVGNTPSEVEKKDFMIFKATLLDAQKEAMKEKYLEPTGKLDQYGRPETKELAFRKNKLDITKISEKVGINETKIDASKIQLSAKTEVDLAKYERDRIIYLVYRPFIMIGNIITRQAFAENTSTIGTSKDYNTITLWEDAKDGDLVTATLQETGVVYNSLSDNFDIDGSNTNATYYMKLTVVAGSRHNGTTSTGVTITLTDQIALSDDYIVLELLIISGGANYINLIASANVGVVVDKCILTGGRYGQIQYIKGTVRNTLFIMPYNEKSLSVSTNGTALNNTLIQTGGSQGKAIYNYNTNMHIDNNICQGYATCFEGWADGTFSTNLGSDATMPGADAIDNVTLDFAGVEDYHLAATDTEAIDAGTSQSGTFADDIDGVTRSGTWDIGADEYVSSTPTRNRLHIF